MRQSIASYQAHLTARRPLARRTIQNYTADLAPFVEYLEQRGLSSRIEDLRSFVERSDPAQVSREYRVLVRDYVAWLLEGRRIQAGRRAGAQGHQQASVLRCLAALRSFFRYCIACGLLPDAPLWQRGSATMRRFAPRPSRRIPDTVTAGEAASLVESPAAQNASALEQALALRDRALLELLYGSGLRVSEAELLDVAHLNLDESIVRVHGKGSKEREGVLGRLATEALSRYLVEGRAELSRGTSCPALFLSRRGRRLSARSIQHLVRRYATRIGLRESVHPHTLRHSYATHLLDGGADLRVVQALLGHSSPTATEVYTHISQTEARRAYLSAHPLALDESGPP